MRKAQISKVTNGSKGKSDIPTPFSTSEVSLEVTSVNRPLYPYRNILCPSMFSFGHNYIGPELLRAHAGVFPLSEPATGSLFSPVKKQQ